MRTNNGRHPSTHYRPPYGASSTLPSANGRQSDQGLRPWLQKFRHPDRQPPHRRQGNAMDLQHQIWRILWLGSLTHHTYEPVNDIAASTTNAQSASSVHRMVMSIGCNPYYGNTMRSAEVHVLAEFGSDFYDVEMRLLILGFIREERDYPR